MKLGLSDAINALRPNSGYLLRGDTYSGLEWDSDNTQTKPTEEELNAKMIALRTTEKPMELLRKERDRLLKETDWRASSDLIISEEWKIPMGCRIYSEIVQKWKSFDPKYSK